MFGMTTKQLILKGIKNVESFVKKLKFILLDKDIEEQNKLEEYFREELNLLFKAQRQVRYFRRTKQDFYILWYLIYPLHFEMVKLHRLNIKKDLHHIFYVLKNNYENFSKEEFLSQTQEFHAKYSIESRKTRLSEAEKAEILKQQANRCAISGAPLFVGDKIEVDHNVPLSKGGTDSVDNLQITHKDSNRSKGSKLLSE
jgi:hypothetical protein